MDIYTRFHRRAIYLTYIYSVKKHCGSPQFSNMTTRFVVLCKTVGYLNITHNGILSYYNAAKALQRYVTEFGKTQNLVHIPYISLEEICVFFYDHPSKSVFNNYAPFF